MTLGWIRVASIVAAICVIPGITFIMSFTLWLAHIVRLRAGNLFFIIAIVSFWLGYEYLSLNSNILSPWINLGNGLAKDIIFIQWYEVTGTSGGSLWILLSNIFLTIYLTKSLAGSKRNKLYLFTWFLIIAIPLIFSISRFYSIKSDPGDESEIVIIQPNYDPYEDKFRLPFDKQLRKVIDMANTAITEKTDWVITPETTVDDPVNENDFDNNKYVKMVKELAKNNPHLSVVTGMTTFKIYPASSNPPTVSARKMKNSSLYYDHFNSAIQIDTGHNINIYKKSRLVPGIEKQFTTGPGKLIIRILPYLGGTQWGYGIQKERVCFEHHKTHMKAAPIICYESVFGKYVTDYVKAGANVLFLMTNDGWWKNTNGYKQHLSYASLRAIETRRPVARAANTGISCIIDIKGRITSKSKWWKAEIIRGYVSNETVITPYVRYGDYLARFSSVIGILIIIVVFIGFPIFKKLK